MLKRFTRNSAAGLLHGSITRSVVPVILTVAVLSAGTVTAQPQETRLAAVVPGPAWAWGNNDSGQLGTAR